MNQMKNNLKRPIVILFTGHVGSSWLTSLLGNHKSITQIGFEPIDDFVIENVDSAPIIEKIIQGAELFQFPEQISKILTKTYEKATEDKYRSNSESNPLLTSFIVFKTRTYLEQQRSLFIELLPKVNPVILFLCRKNKIKNAISQFKRTQLGISHLQDFHEISIKRNPIGVDPSYILRQATNFVRRELVAKSYFNCLTSFTTAPNYEIFYEDLLSVEWRTKFLHNFFHELELEILPVESNYLKMTSDNINDAVKNYDELCNKFYGTAFQPYIQGDDYNIVDEIYTNKLQVPGINAGLIKSDVQSMFS